MGQSSPPWAANARRKKVIAPDAGVKRVKVRGDPEPDWRANFLELRERHIKVVHDNIRLRQRLQEARRKPRRRSRYNTQRDENTWDEDLDRRVEGLRRGGTIDPDW
jgi:hypothetical protein